MSFSTLKLRLFIQPREVISNILTRKTQAQVLIEYYQNNTMKNILLLMILFILSQELRSMPSYTLSSNIRTAVAFQDPAKTSDNKKIDPNKNLSGSTGRYKGQHKHANGKKFATNKRHIKTAKPKGDNGKEKESSQPKGNETGG